MYALLQRASGSREWGARPPSGLQVPAWVLRVAPGSPFVPGRCPGEPQPGPGGMAAGSWVVRGPLRHGMSSAGLRCGVTVACWAVTGRQHWPLRSIQGGPLTFSRPAAELGWGEATPQPFSDGSLPPPPGNDFHPLSKAVKLSSAELHKEMILLH